MLIIDQNVPAPEQMQKQPPNATLLKKKKQRARRHTYLQFIRFALVGCSNTVIDILVLNLILWLWPTRSTAMVLLANSVAYTIGALNSFVLNRSWTFQRSGRPVFGEVRRFALATLGGIVCNDMLLGLLSNAPHPGELSMTLWTNIAKVTSIGGTVLISFLVMRLWVFAHSTHYTKETYHA